MTDDNSNPLKDLKFDNIDKDESISKMKGHVQATQQSITKKAIKHAPENKHISFSFKYWNQIDYFGLGTGVDKNWFVTLLDRLKDVSNKTSSDWETDKAFRAGYRIHAINFEQKNCPFSSAEDLFEKVLQQKEFDIDEEIEIYQFQLSTGRGRIIGFLDADYRFNIILLDPLHNMQPSKSYNYKVNPTKPLECEFEKIQNKIGVISARIQENGFSFDDFKLEFSQIINNDFFDTESRFVELADTFFDTLELIITMPGDDTHIEDILLNAIIEYLDLLRKKIKKLIFNCGVKPSHESQEKLSELIEINPQVIYFIGNDCLNIKTIYNQQIEAHGKIKHITHSHSEKSIKEVTEIATNLNEEKLYIINV